ncbi:hypothetical protein HY085_02395 [Candidatus Gottesmanbacteria bacterium]|nr:hypothetical protein [Candidatus Gottesmanbacteria bacterium]
MVTLNISLPETLAVLVDREVSGGLYASRSEFFRTLLRMYETLVARKPQALEFLEFEKRPLKEIEERFMATGKYDKKFVKELVSGLKKSSIYAN